MKQFYNWGGTRPGLPVMEARSAAVFVADNDPAGPTLSRWLPTGCLSSTPPTAPRSSSRPSATGPTAATATPRSTPQRACSWQNQQYSSAGWWDPSVRLLGMPDFRCSIASLVDDGPMVGTAPADAEVLLVESPGPWGRDAVSDNRLPEAVREHLGSVDMKVFLSSARRQRRSRHPCLPRPRHRDGLRRPRRGARPARGPPAARPRPHVGVRRPAVAGLHQRQARPLLRRDRPTDRRPARGDVARGDVGDHPTSAATGSPARCSHSPAGSRSAGSTPTPPSTRAPRSSAARCRCTGRVAGRAGRPSTRPASCTSSPAAIPPTSS